MFTLHIANGCKRNTISLLISSRIPVLYFRYSSLPLATINSIPHVSCRPPEALPLSRLANNFARLPRDARARGQRRDLATTNPNPQRIPRPDRGIFLSARTFRSQVFQTRDSSCPTRELRSTVSSLQSPQGKYAWHCSKVSPYIYYGFSLIIDINRFFIPRNKLCRL